MSALGDYIHLYAKNYDRYGTANPTENEHVSKISYDYINSKVFINQRLAFVKPISDETISILQQRLRANTSTTFNQEKNEWAVNQQRLIDYIYELLFTQVKNVSLGAERLYNTTSGKGVVWTQDKTPLTLSTTKQWASQYSYDQLKSLREKKKAQREQIEKLITEINSSQQPQSDKKLQKLIQLYEAYSDITPKSNENVLAEIEKAMGENVYKGTIQQVAGKFGEQLVATCADAAKTMGKKEFVKFLSEAVKGESRSEIHIDTQDINLKKANFLKTDDSGNKYYLGTTQNKTDVEIQINNEDIFATVKDYAAVPGQFRNPDLQDVNLFQTIAFLNNYLDNFGNHWINMHALKNSKKWSNQKEADAIVNKEVAYEALIGGSPFKSVEPANLFIYIERAKGYVFIERTTDLMLQHFERFNMKSVGDIMLHNRKVQAKYGSEERIASILSQLHKINIAVSLNITPDI